MSKKIASAFPLLMAPKSFEKRVEQIQFMFLVEEFWWFFWIPLRVRSSHI